MVMSIIHVLVHQVYGTEMKMKKFYVMKKIKTLVQNLQNQNQNQFKIQMNVWENVLLAIMNIKMYVIKIVKM